MVETYLLHYQMIAIMILGSNLAYLHLSQSRILFRYRERPKFKSIQEAEG